MELQGTSVLGELLVSLVWCLVCLGKQSAVSIAGSGDQKDRLKL